MQIGCLGHICKIWDQRGYSNVHTPKVFLFIILRLMEWPKALYIFDLAHFQKQLIHKKCARTKMQEILGHYICFFFVESRVLIFQDSRFLFTAKLLRIDMKNLRFNRYTKSRLYLGYTNMTVYTRLTVYTRMTDWFLKKNRTQVILHVEGWFF